MATISVSRPAAMPGNILSRNVTALVAAFLEWKDARATRIVLSKLTDRELDDIGLVRGDIDGMTR